MRHDLHASPAESKSTVLVCDLFCRVIDNFGDIGVCWRLCADLALRGHSVRLWVDDPSALQWMAPGSLNGQWQGIRVLPWSMGEDADFVQQLPLADVWIEGFGCEMPAPFIAEGVRRCAPTQAARPPVWLNLEYLSAENYVARSHGLASPVMSGPAKGWTKYFFFPGFTLGTGGLLREADIHHRQTTFDAESWLAGHGVRRSDHAHIVSLFCYEPPALQALLSQWAEGDASVAVLVTAGRASDHVRHCMGISAEPKRCDIGALTLFFLPTLTQIDFDHLLWACDLNAVRGEDSIVRAIWAAKPLLWQIYPQSDDAHHAKLDAFLQVLEADHAHQQLHYVWNGVMPTPTGDILDWKCVHEWAQHAKVTGLRLAENPDLTSALLQFVQKKR